jgi:hypothetical protein
MKVFVDIKQAFGVVQKAEWRGVDVAVKQLTGVEKFDEFVAEVKLMRALVHTACIVNANTVPPFRDLTEM